MEMRDIAEGSARISELSAAETLGDGDLMMFSNRLSGSGGQSVKVTVEQLFQYVNAGLLRSLSAGSMAYESKYKYAKSDHSHDFSKINIVTRRFAPEEKIGTAVVTNGNLTETSSDVCVPSYSKLVWPEPYVGELTCMVYGQKTKDQIQASIAAGTFDGWVYPDGSVYSKTTQIYDFASAWRLYGISDSQFRVPDLRNFFKLNSEQFETTGLMPYQVGIAQHGHELNKTVGGTFHSKAYIYGTVHQARGKNDTLVAGTKSSTSVSDNRNVRIDAPIGFELVSGAVADTDDMQTEDESYPSHNVVPCMIYIGNSKLGGV